MKKLMVNVDRKVFPVGTITAFGGMEITPNPQEIPMSFLEEVKRHPYLAYKLVEEIAADEAVKISPAALKLAEEAGIEDLGVITPSGKDGTIVAGDVKAYLAEE